MSFIKQYALRSLNMQLELRLLFFLENSYTRFSFNKDMALMPIFYRPYKDNGMYVQKDGNIIKIMCKSTAKATEVPSPLQVTLKNLF